MLRLASRGVAVANADAALRRAGVLRTRRPYQSGLAEAVHGLVGHRPGSCAVCALPPAPTHARRMMLELLRAQERGRIGITIGALRLIGLARTRAGS